MHSFISNSRKPGLRDVVLLLSACAVICICLEAGTAYFFGHLSRIENRRETEYQKVLSIRSSRISGTESVLVAGNSLLLEGVNFPALQQDVGPTLQLQRTVVEGTFYLDWYYGLRRLFDVGARPDAVVLVLNPVQLTSHAIGSDYTAHFMVDRKDLFRFALDVGADRNRLSSLVLSNFSFFYGARAEIRNWILGQLLPDLPRLSRGLRHDQKPADPASLQELAIERLTQLHELCQQHSANLVFVIPPANEDLGATAIARQATAQGIQVIMPIAPGELPATDYSDGFHLNFVGAGKFTPELALGLKQVLQPIDGIHNQSTRLSAGVSEGHSSPVSTQIRALATTAERSPFETVQANQGTTASK
jgi:hypothetical protein